MAEGTQRRQSDLIESGTDPSKELASDYSSSGKTLMPITPSGHGQLTGDKVSSTTSRQLISKVIIDSLDDIRPIPTEDKWAHQRSSIIFFSASLSIFAAIGIVIFIRKCVRCPITTGASTGSNASNRNSRRPYLPSPALDGVNAVRESCSPPKSSDHSSNLLSPDIGHMRNQLDPAYFQVDISI